MADYRTVRQVHVAQDDGFMDQDTEMTQVALDVSVHQFIIRRLLVSTSCPCVPSLLRLASTNKRLYVALLNSPRMAKHTMRIAQFG